MYHNHLDEVFSDNGPHSRHTNRLYVNFHIFVPCSIITFPVSEILLCYFASYLTTHLSPQTIKTYLAGIRHTQIRLGLPESREFSSLPRLRLIQAGIARVHALPPPSQRWTRIRLPINPAILRGVHGLWSSRAVDWGYVTIDSGSSHPLYGYTSSSQKLTNCAMGWTSLWGKNRLPPGARWRVW